MEVINLWNIMSKKGWSPRRQRSRGVGGGDRHREGGVTNIPVKVKE